MMVNKHSRRLTVLNRTSERRPASEAESQLAAINVAHVEVGGGVTGFIFTIGIIYIFVVGVPSLWWFLVGAMVLGVVVSMALQLFHGHKPSRMLVLGMVFSGREYRPQDYD